jgi:cytochrome c-type biogenesis protein CcmH/NrfG
MTLFNIDDTRHATGSGLGDVFKQHLSVVYVNLGKGYLRRENSARAIDALRLAHKLAPGRPQIAAALSSAYTALALSEEKRGDEGIEALNRALEVDPNNVEALRLAKKLAVDRDGS